MKAGTPFDMATAPKRESRLWRQESTTWGDLVAMAKHPANVKECGNYVLGTLRETPDPEHGGRMTRRRTKSTIVTRGAITLDADHARPDLPDKLEMLSPGAAIIHTTFSSTPASPRYRIIVPLDRVVLPDEYWAIAEVLMNTLGHDQFDPGSREAWRYMFRPSAAPGAPYEFRIVDGPAASADELLRGFDYDLSNRQTPRANRTKRDPFTLPDVAGAFNRAYTVEEAIEAFELPYESAGVGRWHYAHAAAQAGLNTVTDGLVYSHHVTDPAGGKTCSAYDLVRLHRFGHLDEDCENTPVNRLPSSKAMAEFITGEDGEHKADERVKKELFRTTREDLENDFADDFEAWQGEMADSDDWMLALDTDSKGKVQLTPKNWKVIRERHPVFQSLYYDEMSMAIETSGLPWRDITKQGGPTFSSGDQTRLALRLDEEFRRKVPRGELDEQIMEAALSRWRNRVREYLNELKWDGQKRVETCLPGVRPTAYTKMVARKSLVAAVARMMEPGIKWDHTLILYGAEGLGKTFWVETMARGFSATLADIRNKDTLLAMHRSWIMVADEGFSLRKADNDVMKEFLTRRADVFRAPYDRETVVHQRMCVIWGSTNDEVFLRRQEGNRRFLIVRCEEKADFDILTPEYVDQVWAEAVALYRGGEKLYLTDRQNEMAGKEREEFTEEDTLSGIVETYLDTLVPADWEEKSIESRQLWLANRADGIVAEGTEPITRTCSLQLWCEALGRTRGEHRPTDLRDLNAVLKKLPGWKVLPSRHRLTHYGPQQVFERVEN